jgi:uncharacterized circularly permuted ATP-grasp superfamily protein
MAARDELLENGVPRPGFEDLWRQLEDIGSSGLLQRGIQRDAYLSMQGITFNLSGEERPLPVDVIPRVIDAGEWSLVESGLRQRIRALEAFLDDVYGDQESLGDGVVPRALVASSEHFHRAVHGLRPANGVRVHVAGIDLVRDEAGVLRVLEDNLRCPSGVSYVLENRRTLAHVVPELFSGYAVRSVQEYPERLLKSLIAAAPAGVDDPTVVVLTPGVFNSAHFEHAFLARRMGVELVEGRDLFCKGNMLFMRTTRGSAQVHVVYRRIDDDFLDPVAFRPDSILGVPGLVMAARAGNVTIANAIGNGVADDKALYPYVPQLIQYFLGEKPILPNVDTFDLRNEEARKHVLANLDEMVVKPVAGSGGYGIMIGPRATSAEIASMCRVIEDDPRGWVAQPVVQLSTCPTVGSDGRIVQRHVDLRPFAVNDGNEVWVLPGGLTRVALKEGSLVVNSSQGGGSKDTWVLAASGDVVDPTAPITRPGRVAEQHGDSPLAPKESGPNALPDVRLQQQEEQQQQQDGSGSCTVDNRVRGVGSC